MNMAKIVTHQLCIIGTGYAIRLEPGLPFLGCVPSVSVSDPARVSSQAPWKYFIPSTCPASFRTRVGQLRASDDSVLSHRLASLSRSYPDDHCATYRQINSRPADKMSSSINDRRSVFTSYGWKPCPDNTPYDIIMKRFWGCEALEKDTVPGLPAWLQGVYLRTMRIVVVLIPFRSFAAWKRQRYGARACSQTPG